MEELESKLKAFQAIPEEEFLGREELHVLAERYLHLAVECMIDIGNHMLSDRSTQAAGTYRDVFRALGQEGLIPVSLAAKLESWAGFRNVLVHLYLDVDHRVSWRAITEELGDLTDFRKAIAGKL